jgi:23S rRNA (adenine2503-C2)-methyltransferase
MLVSNKASIKIRPNQRDSIYSLTYEELKAWLRDQGEAEAKAQDLFRLLYKKRVESFDEMTIFSKELRDKLQNTFKITTLNTITKQVSKDQTTKFLFELVDGFSIETVLMRHDYGNSVCVTTQVGCRIGCTFCASTLGGLKRQLEAGEIVSQVMKVQKYLDETNERVSSIVIMGIGEPFDNYEEMLAFLKVMNNDYGLNIGARHITVSTSGIIPKIYKFADEEMQISFAVSLHAANDELRTKLMPINKAYNLEKLLKAVEYYTEKTGRRVTFEYGLFGGENDSIEHAKELANRIRHLKCHVNLIPVNYVPERNYVRTPEDQIQSFYQALVDEGIFVTLRREQGHDIDAACGQLRAKERNEETR